MNHFYSMLFRMRYINRWGLMRNTFPENISEHSLEVAVVAHALAVIGNRRFKKAYDAEHIAMLGLFHDASEILTGDLPTPVKYYNPRINEAYKQVEDTAKDKLLSMLPSDLREEYRDLFYPQDATAVRLVKAADKITAYIKCIEEEKAGNREFSKAAQTLRRSIDEMQLPEADTFMREFMESFTLTLDEQD
jgi:5'-deoxynucleotidase